MIRRAILSELAHVIKAYSKGSRDLNLCFPSLARTTVREEHSHSSATTPTTHSPASSTQSLVTHLRVPRMPELDSAEAVVASLHLPFTSDASDGLELELQRGVPARTLFALLLAASKHAQAHILEVVRGIPAGALLGTLSSAPAFKDLLAAAAAGLGRVFGAGLLTAETANGVTAFKKGVAHAKPQNSPRLVTLSTRLAPGPLCMTPDVGQFDARTLSDIPLSSTEAEAGAFDLLSEVVAVPECLPSVPWGESSLDTTMDSSAACNLSVCSSSPMTARRPTTPDVGGLKPRQLWARAVVAAESPWDSPTVSLPVNHHQQHDQHQIMKPFASWVHLRESSERGTRPRLLSLVSLASGYGVWTQGLLEALAFRVLEAAVAAGCAGPDALAAAASICDSTVPGSAGLVVPRTRTRIGISTRGELLDVSRSAGRFTAELLAEVQQRLATHKVSTSELETRLDQRADVISRLVITGPTPCGRTRDYFKGPLEAGCS